MSTLRDAPPGYGESGLLPDVESPATRPSDPVAAPHPAGDPLRSLPAALLAAATAWVSVLSWRGMAEDPGRISRPLVVAALIVAVVGWAVRRTTGRAWAAVPVQLVVLVVWLMHLLTGAWVPGPGSVRTLVAEIGDGIVASERYYSPVSVQHPEYHFLITLGGVGIILAVDLLVCGLRQPALAGLPLLLVVTIAASVLLDPIDLRVFVGTALGWLSLLVVREAGRLDAWSLRADPAQLAPTAAAIAAISVVVALVLTGGVTAEGRLLHGPDGDGEGDGSSLNVNNPMLDMRRNLRQDADIDLVTIRAPQAANPAYLRLTVLDEFNGEAWKPSDRSAADTEPVEGDLPFPVGLSPDRVSDRQSWQISVDQAFGSSWLPLPTPTTGLSVDPRWRYDPRTLDVFASRGSAAGLDYRVDTFTPTIDVAAARTAAVPSADITNAETRLPDDLPAVFEETARRVTRGADNSWDRAVALQDWFRTGGAFTYSTDPAPGNGIDTLTRFITSGKVGYCEQFATAMAVLARSLGIPARVSVGFLQPERNSDGAFVFSSKDLHAWPELYFQGQGWVRFEPTPSGRAGSAAPPYTVDQQVDPEATAVPTPSASASTAAPEAAPDSTDSATSTGGGPGIGAWLALGVVVALLLVLLLALPRLLLARRRRRRWEGSAGRRELADAAWSEVREVARSLDLGWSDTSSVRVNGARVRQAVPAPDAQQVIDEVVRYVELTRYASPASSPGSRPGSAGPDDEDRDAVGQRERIRSDVARWRAAAYDAADPRVARRARWALSPRR